MEYTWLIHDLKAKVQDEDSGYKGIVYTELIPVLISAIKELKAEIESLKSQINV
jgi:hypothetical protein